MMVNKLTGGPGVAVPYLVELTKAETSSWWAY